MYNTYFKEKQNFITAYLDETKYTQSYYNSIRIKALLKALMYKLISFFILLVTVLFFIAGYIYIHNNQEELIILKCFFLVFFSGAILYCSIFFKKNADKIKKKYSEDIKSKYIDKLIEKLPFKLTRVSSKLFFNNKNRQYIEHIYTRIYDEIWESNLFSKYTEDFVDDTYVLESNGNKCYLAETTLKKEIETRYFNYNITVFRGLFVSFDLPFKTKEKILITARKTVGNKTCFFINDRKQVSIDNTLIELGTKEVDSFLSELLDNIRKVFNAKQINLLIYNNKIVLTVYSKQDLFEIADIHNKINDTYCIKKFYDEIYSINNLFEYFIRNRE